MKIISKFYDYYDSCQSYDSDETLVYIRKTEELFISFKKESQPQELREYIKSIRNIPLGRILNGFMYKGGLFFCGKRYPFYSFDDKYYFSFEELLEPLIRKLKSNSVSPIYNNHPRQFRWKQQEYKDKIKYLRGKNLSKADKIFNPAEKWVDSVTSLNSYTWEGWKNTYKQDIGDLPFIYLDCPIFTITKQNSQWVIEKNPELQELNFTTQLDPYMTYQEIEMYLGNNLVKQLDPNIYIPDELKAQSKGFNKWSFRKQGKKSRRG